MTKQIKVGIGDMKLARQEGELITYALGSCIGITFYDPMIKLGALVHIMLPERMSGTDQNLFKYADTGIKETLRKMTAFGGVKSRMICKIAGGARMFEIQGNSSLGNIGERNILSVKKILRNEGIRISAEDTGSNIARTLLLDIESGRVKVRTAGRQEREL